MFGQYFWSHWSSHPFLQLPSSTSIGDQCANWLRTGKTTCSKEILRSLPEGLMQPHGQEVFFQRAQSCPMAKKKDQNYSEKDFLVIVSLRRLAWSVPQGSKAVQWPDVFFPHLKRESFLDHFGCLAALVRFSRPPKLQNEKECGYHWGIASEHQNHALCTHKFKGKLAAK